MSAIMKAAISIGGLLVAGAVVFGGIVVPTEGVAQTATNLKCKGCVGKKDLGKKAVTGKAIKNEAVTSRDIRNNTIAPVDLAPAAKPGGVDWVDGDQDIDLTGVAMVIRTLVVSAPVPGYVTVLASWVFGGTPPINFIAVCGISQTTSIDSNHAVSAEWEANVSYVPGSAVRTFEVGSGNTAFYLNCRSGAGSPAIGDSSMTAMFSPNRY